jgi:competence protein ComEC
MKTELSSATEKPPARVAARPLIPVFLALALGMAGSAWGMRLPGWGLAIAIAVLFLMLVLLWRGGRRTRLLPLAMFWLLGLALAQQALSPVLPGRHVAHLPQEQEIILRGRLWTPPQIREGSVRLILEASHWRSPQGWRRASGKVLITGALPYPPAEGAEVAVRTALRQFRDAPNPGAFPRARYWAAQDIFREGRFKDPTDLLVLASPQSPGVRERLREGLRLRLASLEPLSRSLYLAVILGDQGEITQPMRQAFSRTGTSHLLAISGLHLGMLAGLSFFLIFRLLRCFPWVLLRANAFKLALALAAGPVVAYAWIAGGSPATRRASIMILAYLLLVLLGRPREVASALALAALIILTLSPLLLFTLSFQLSFLSVAALIYFLPRWLSPPDPEARPRIHRGKWQRRAFFWGRGALFWIRGAALTSLVATLAVAPLVAASFHIVSLLGVLINLAAIPLVSLAAVPLGLLALAAAGLHLPAAAQGLLWLGSFFLKGAYAVISWGATLPGAALTLPTPTWLQIGLYYALLVLIFPPKRTPATWGGAALAAVILLGSLAGPVYRTPKVCELTVLDSYTGLAGVLVTPDDRRLVISGGRPDWPGREGAAIGPLPAYLHGRQFRRLDGALALSLTSRNAPELLQIAQEFSLQETWLEGGTRGPEAVRLRNFLGDRGNPARSLLRGPAPAALGEVKLAYYALERGRGAALEISCSARRVLIFPPLALPTFGSPPAAAASPLEALVVPWEPPPAWLEALKPGYVVVYGRSETQPARLPSPLRTVFLFTREGAVTLHLAPPGVAVKQWRR